MAKSCPSCGHKIEVEGAYCLFCGAALPKSEPQTLAPQEKGGAPQNKIALEPLQLAQTRPEPAPREAANPAPQASQVSRDVSDVLKGVVAALVFGIAGIIGYQLWQDKEAAKVPPPAVTDTAKATTTDSKSTSEKAAAEARLNDYVNTKDRLDKEIAELATDINNYLGGHANFKGADSLRNRSKTIVADVENLKTNVSKDEVIDKAAKQKLLEVINAESGRVGGLDMGMKASAEGGDYKRHFQLGTDAAYRYDDLNAELNNMLRHK